MPKKFAVIGNPIYHSKSPYIHQYFASKLSIDIEYVPLLATTNNFPMLLKQLINENFQGVNITAPFKQAAYQLASTTSSQTRLLFAANTLSFTKPNFIHADNTDGEGFLRDIILHKNVNLENAKILLLGAGGAAWALAHTLSQQPLALLTIANRNLNNAVVLANSLITNFGVNCLSLDDVFTEQFDMVINSTSGDIAKIISQKNRSIFHSQPVYYDLRYDTNACQLAQQWGAKHVFNGWGMLVEQAALAFSLWHGVLPETKELVSSVAIPL